MTDAATNPAAVVPELSIVMTIVDGGEVLRKCLDALAEQVSGPQIEVLVPFDYITKADGAMAARYPHFTFVDLGTILGGELPTNPNQMHAFYDTRRAEAMKRARGNLIAILEDRGVPDPNWCQTMIRIHRENRHGVIGGAVTNGVDRGWNWAIFFCDFGRYQPPLREDEPEYVTDTNIVYKRDTIMSVRHLWEVKYQEAQVNWELCRNGAGLMLTDAAVTEQNRPPVSVGKLVSERYHWARLFGHVRARELTVMQRIKLALGIPLLPFLLLVRHFRRQVSKGQHVGKFIQVAPLTLFLLLCWSAGEFVGNAEGAEAAN